MYTQKKLLIMRTMLHLSAHFNLIFYCSDKTIVIFIYIVFLPGSLIQGAHVPSARVSYPSCKGKGGGELKSFLPLNAFSIKLIEQKKYKF